MSLRKIGNRSGVGAIPKLRAINNSIKKGTRLHQIIDLPMNVCQRLRNRPRRGRTSGILLIFSELYPELRLRLPGLNVFLI